MNSDHLNNTLIEEIVKQLIDEGIEGLSSVVESLLNGAGCVA